MFTAPTSRALTILAVALSTPLPLWAQSFGYLGDIGPAHWSDLSPNWATCNFGEMQSPVNLKSSSRHQAKHSRKLSISYGETTGEIFNNGHTIEVETEDDNVLMLDGVPYQLTQFHFHTPSEHRIDRRGYDMELHLVHSGSDGSNAVIAVFLKRGSNSGALAPIFAALPDTLDVHEPLDEPFKPEKFLPKSRDHFRYEGSLTTPPCTEGVRWIVMSQPVSVSDEDMAQFAERIRFNGRYVQRTVKQ
jgi:carbonic anhydrase